MEVPIDKDSDDAVGERNLSFRNSKNFYKSIADLAMIWES